MFKRFKEIFISPEVIEIYSYRCGICGSKIPSFIEKKIDKTGDFTICKCGANQVVRANPSRLGKILTILSYILKGY